MTTPGFISRDEYTDPGPLINSHFSETFARARERIAKEQEELQAEEEAEAAEDTEDTDGT